MGMLGNFKPRIINVTRKPSKCPDCGEEVLDIIYGTGDMTEREFLFKYPLIPQHYNLTLFISS